MKLLQKEVYFVINSNCEDDLILINPNFQEPFPFTTNDSAFAVEAVFSQGQIGVKFCNSVCIKKLSSAETNYPTIEREKSLEEKPVVRTYPSYVKRSTDNIKKN